MLRVFREGPASSGVDDQIGARGGTTREELAGRDFSGTDPTLMVHLDLTIELDHLA